MISHPRFHILKNSTIALINDQVIHKVAWLKQKMSLLNYTAMSSPKSLLILGMTTRMCEQSGRAHLNGRWKVFIAQQINP